MELFYILNVLNILRIYDYFLAYTEWVLRSFWIFIIPIVFMYFVATRIIQLSKEEGIKNGR
jgi:hypothetical protein